MSDIEKQIRERAYSLWERGEGVHGRHEDHWRQAERELTGHSRDNGAGTVSPQPETVAVDAGEPPARSGKAEQSQMPVEAGDQSNPVHHNGRLPPNLRPV
ncbi:DUF2934 domain-containing protein [Pararhizobium gei]|uniref:DUF2934 domain-containing protein n=1 Tax=Pararhizobium gei TaxID=1395951 RepID=UPI0023DA3921|nr:DUF2934 domain-containing protein [Rhizobium gei]